MTPDPALDAAIRQARHLLFAFDGPIRIAYSEKPADPTTPTAPHIHEALAACRDSGRSVVVIAPKPLIDVNAFLDAYHLTQVTIIAASIGDAVSTLEAPPADCLLITSSPADIKAAQTAGLPSIGYARTPDDAAHLVNAGASSSVYSMANIALGLRASTPVDNDERPQSN
jgi:beta-phosphoglucomutase-like phosphatase (HAD superfamily)